MAPLGNKNGQTHGGAHTPEYDAWANMKARCTNPNNPQYKDYGGRGIKYCFRWRRFENFIEDMGPRPAPHLTIERIDNNKGYSKQNCRWATRKEQQRNSRVYPTRMAREAERLGIPYKTLWARRKRERAHG